MPSNHVLLTEYFAQDATSHEHPVGLFNKIIFYQTFAAHFPHTQAHYPLQPICLRILNTQVSLKQMGNQCGLLECCCIGLHLNSHLCLAEQKMKKKKGKQLAFKAFLQDFQFSLPKWYIMMVEQFCQFHIITCIFLDRINKKYLRRENILYS